MHAVAAARDLVGQRLGVRRGRIGVRHLEHCGDAAEHGGARAGLEILLLGQPGLAEMHLGVDDAGQHVQALRLDHRAPGGAGEVADRRDPAAGYADIAYTLAVLVDDRAAAYDHIEGISHSQSALETLRRAPYVPAHRLARI